MSGVVGFVHVKYIVVGPGVTENTLVGRANRKYTMHTTGQIEKSKNTVLVAGRVTDHTSRSS